MQRSNNFTKLLSFEEIHNFIYESFDTLTTTKSKEKIKMKCICFDSIEFYLNFAEAIRSYNEMETLVRNGNTYDRYC